MDRAIWALTRDGLGYGLIARHWRAEQETDGIGTSTWRIIKITGLYPFLLLTGSISGGKPKVIYSKRSDIWMLTLHSRHESSSWPVCVGICKFYRCWKGYGFGHGDSPSFLEFSNLI